MTPNSRGALLASCLCVAAGCQTISLVPEEQVRPETTVADAAGDVPAIPALVIEATAAYNGRIMGSDLLTRGYADAMLNSFAQALQEEKLFTAVYVRGVEPPGDAAQVAFQRRMTIELGKASFFKAFLVGASFFTLAPFVRDTVPGENVDESRVKLPDGREFTYRARTAGTSTFTPMGRRPIEAFQAALANETLKRLFRRMRADSRRWYEPARTGAVRRGWNGSDMGRLTIARRADQLISLSSGAPGGGFDLGNRGARGGRKLRDFAPLRVAP